MGATKLKPRGKPFEKGNTKGFKKGNAGGPGRQKRETEKTYLIAMRDNIPLDAWIKIVARAKKDAMAGDARARDWISKYLVGDDPITIIELYEELEQVKAINARVEKLVVERQRQHQRDQQPESVNGQTGTDGPYTA